MFVFNGKSPNSATIESVQALENHRLKAMGISKFEADFSLWQKLRNMEEYHTHSSFRHFVQYLEQELFKETFPTTDEGAKH
ncbi:hypothetical protein [Nitrosopumilus sp.]|uniref:hypothetical protein n=1 Tax=Nitrosopumilus sp. TaxID=2024843 RepID=UPI003D10489A